MNGHPTLSGWGGEFPLVLDASWHKTKIKLWHGGNPVVFKPVFVELCSTREKAYFDREEKRREWDVCMETILRENLMVKYLHD